jgi:hypothetical protein
MKKIFLLAAVIVMAAGTSLVSCKKASNTFTVQYKIVGLTSDFISITYKDASGASIVDTDITKFQSGYKDISVPDGSKPFYAQITTEVNNQTNATINYELVILVDGQIKSVKPCSVPPKSITTGEADFTVM